MHDLIELRRQRKALLEEAQALIDKAKGEKRALTTEEDQRINTCMTEADQLKGQIEAREVQEAREARLAAERAAMGNIPEPRGGRPDPSGNDPPNITGGHNRAQDKPWRNLGEFLQAVAHAGQQHVTEREWDPRLKFRAPSGLSGGVPADGGFLVMKDFAAELLKRTTQTGLLLSRFRTVPIGANADGLKINAVDESSRANGSRWGGIVVYRRNEADSATASKPKFRQISLDLEDMVGLCYATDNLLRDTTALGAVITQGFSEEFGFKVDDEAFSGTGAGQMQGILNAPCLVSVAKETGQAASTIVVENVFKMWSRMWARSRSSAVWHINQDVEPQLFGMTMSVGTGGVPVYMPAGGVSGQPFSTLFGRPIIPMEQCSTVGTVGDIVLADWSQYLFIDKGEIEAADSIHVRFLFSERTFRFVWQNNGQPIWNSALTPYKGANTLSPFVALATRS